MSSTDQDVPSTAMGDVQMSQPSDSQDDPLLNQVNCQICTEIYHNPVSLHFCGHVFCGNNTCPLCRATVTKATHDFRANSLLEIYLKMNPARARSAEEIQQLDKEYKRGQPIPIAPDTIGFDSEDDDIGGVALYYEPCPTCAPNNPHGFLCPVPIPTAPGQQIPQHHPCPQGHTGCGFCDGLMPVRNIAEEKCGSCNTFSCSYLTDCNRQKLTKFSDFDFDAFMPDDHLITANCFNQNVIELAMFLNYKHDQHISNNDLRDIFLEQYQLHPGSMQVGRPLLDVVDKDTLLCNGCCIQLFTNPLFKWWATQVNEHKVITDDRPKCWYGNECRTQRHNIAHAQRLNHLGGLIDDPHRVNAFPSR